MKSNLDDCLIRFGKSSWRPCQRELALAALEGHSCLGVFPTGYGKSICYQIPATLLPGVSVIVSPLIALMKDQVESLLQVGIAAARYDSSLSNEEKSRLLSDLRTLQTKILFVAPESLETPELFDVLSSIPLGLLVIDEAHCLSEWGHSFRPDYLSIPRVAQILSFHAIMALTATANKQVRQDLAQSFSLSSDHVFVLPPYKSGLIRQVKVVNEADRLGHLKDLLDSPTALPAIVYVSSRKDSDALCYELSQAGINCRSYHAGMSPETRLSVQDDFLADRVDVLVATIAFGMGVDKPNVRSVVHYDPPTSIESYVQESGRAGRDGASACSTVFLTEESQRKVINRISSSLSDESSLLNVLRLLCGGGERILSLYETCTQYDVADIRLNRMIYDLEALGLIKVRSKGLKNYQVKPLFPLSEILFGRDEEEIRLLTWLAENPKGAIENLTWESSLSWDEAQAWFADLALSGEWTVKLTQQSLRIQSGNEAQMWLKSHAKDYVTHLNEACNREQTRWNALRDLFEGNSCINQALDMYFCDQSELTSCGHCQTCLQGSICLPSSLPSHELNADQYEAMVNLSQKGSVALKTPLQWARFLMGYSSPASLRARLWSHSLYGSLKDWAWEDVMNQARLLAGDHA